MEPTTELEGQPTGELTAMEVADEHADLITTPVEPDELGAVEASAEVFVKIDYRLQMALNELVKQVAAVEPSEQEQFMSDLGLSANQMYDIMNAVDERYA